MKVEVAVLASVPNTPTVSVDVKQHFSIFVLRVVLRQLYPSNAADWSWAGLKLCQFLFSFTESVTDGGTGHGPPELRSCVKVEVAVPGSRP